MSAYHLPALSLADELELFPHVAAPATTEEVARDLALGPPGLGLCVTDQVPHKT
jgi:hypothetical protein